MIIVNLNQNDFNPGKTLIYNITYKKGLLIEGYKIILPQSISISYFFFQFKELKQMHAMFIFRN